MLLRGIVRWAVLCCQGSALLAPSPFLLKWYGDPPATRLRGMRVGWIRVQEHAQAPREVLRKATGKDAKATHTHTVTDAWSHRSNQCAASAAHHQFCNATNRRMVASGSISTMVRSFSAVATAVALQHHAVAQHCTLHPTNAFAPATSSSSCNILHITTPNVAIALPPAISSFNFIQFPTPNVANAVQLEHDAIH